VLEVDDEEVDEELHAAAVTARPANRATVLGVRSITSRA
jgi:hypothetical protein